MKISEIITRMRKQAKLSQKELADKLTVSQTVVAFLELGKRTPSKEISLRLARLFGLPIQVFLDEDFDFNFDSMEAKTVNSVSIPYMSTSASAGVGFYNGLEYAGQMITITEGHILKLLRGVRDPVMLAISGDSMMPTIHDRGVVIVAPHEKEIVEGKIYILTIGNMTHVKRLFLNPITQKIMCRSDNQFYPQIDADPTEVTIHGRVISQLLLDL